MNTMVLEGTWEEIAQHAEELAGRRLMVTVLDDAPVPQPNRKVVEIMRRVEERQKDMNFTDGSKTQEILRKGRAGEMFGYQFDY